jgi:hypothetical protein
MSAYSYEHTQAGTLMRIIFGAMIVGFGSVAVGLLIAGKEFEGVVGLGGGSGFMLVLMFLFHSLSVRISPEWVRLSFGIGLIGKKFAVGDIESAAVVRTHWYNGWGIKKIMGGWLFNVSGFDVVEIRLGNGRRYMIGTDEPQSLCEAIEGAIAQGKR